MWRSRLMSPNTLVFMQIQNQRNKASLCSTDVKLKRKWVKHRNMLWCLLFGTYYFSSDIYEHDKMIITMISTIAMIISCSTCNDYLVFMGKLGQPWGEFTNLAAQVLEEEFFIRSSSMARLAKGLRDSWGHLCYSFCCTDASSILRHRQSCWVLVSKSWRAIFASLEKYVLPFRR